MIWACVGISQYARFRMMFRETHGDREWIDLSDIGTYSLVDHCDAILAHHAKPCVFLGFLEPGWMMEHVDQTRLRELFRKCPVGFVCHFEDSIPFSWKNETDVLYIPDTHTKHGYPYIVYDGGAVHDKPEVQHDETS